jgi:predicted DNA-binding protein (UPF0251 family)
MARHTRRLPRNRQEREQAKERAARLLERLAQQADEARQLESAASEASAKLERQILRHVDRRELDITDMANRTGITRQTIHRWIAKQQRPFRVGQRVTHSFLGRGTVEFSDAAKVHVQFELTSVTFDLATELESLSPA